MTHVQWDLRIYIHIRVRVCVYADTCTCVCVYVCIVYVCVYMRARMCVFTLTHVMDYVIQLHILLIVWFPINSIFIILIFSRVVILAFYKTNFVLRWCSSLEIYLILRRHRAAYFQPLFGFKFPISTLTSSNPWLKQVLHENCASQISHISIFYP